MDIKAISTISLPQTVDAPKTVQMPVQENKEIKKSYKKLPYVAAGIVLAGFGAYLMRGKIGKFFQKENVPIKSAFREMKDKIEIGKAEIIAKIERIKNEHNQEINEIINKNIKDGHVDLPTMRKIASDFADDVINGGDDRFHQAADILEQSYIREFVKGNAEKKEGLQNFFDFTNGDGVLFNIYTKMPMDEAANRLHYLKINDFKSAQHKGMDPEQFFKTSYGRLCEKFQFKFHNQAFRIEDGAYTDVLQKNQELRKSVTKILADLTEDSGNIDWKVLKQIIERETDLHLGAELMERALLKKPVLSKSVNFSQFEKEFLENDELFNIYKKLPLNEAKQRINVFRRFSLESNFQGVDEAQTLAFYDKACAKLTTP